MVFFYLPRPKLASVALVNMDDVGDMAAAAMSVLVRMISVGVRLL